MSFSLGFRIVNLRHVCKLWSTSCLSTSFKYAKNKNVICQCQDSKGVGMMCNVANGRLFSSDSHTYDVSVEDERRKLKDDPEIKAWMSQIAQDFETAPFQALVQDQPHSHHNVDKASSSLTSVQDASDTEVEVEEFGYIEDDEDDFSEPIPERILPVSLQRGEHGVFDVEEVVAVLEDENGVDIQVIDIPPEARFVDHMVIVSGKSLRHMRAMAASMEWLYKRKKTKKDRSFKLEGRDCKDWFAMDLGNIAVHIFTQEARQHYDIETLWTLGPEHDDQRHYVHDDSLNLSAADLFWLESGSSQEPSSPYTTDSRETVTNDGSKGHTHHSWKTGPEDVENHKDTVDSAVLQEKLGNSD